MLKSSDHSGTSLDLEVTIDESHVHSSFHYLVSYENRYFLMKDLGPSSGEDRSVHADRIMSGVLGVLASLGLIGAWLLRNKRKARQCIYHLEEGESRSDLQASVQHRAFLADPFPYSPPPSNSLVPTNPCGT